jgi:hypothetical protein
MPKPVDDDSTVVMPRPISSGVRSPRIPVWWIVAPVALVLLVAGGGWSLWSSSRIATQPPATTETVQSPPQPETAVPPIAATAPEPDTARATPDWTTVAIGSATEQQILDHVPAEGAPDPAVFRFKANPGILVFDFASLLDQGRMLNRVAALIEKTGVTHDRLLNDAELSAAIKASGDTVETFYYGHDYGVASLVRFFGLADRDGVQLNVEEVQLGRLIRREGWFEPNVHAALISIPRVGADAQVTRFARATILHHELSHGEYFTNTDYVAFVHRFWTKTLTQAERDRFKNHLHSIGYDWTLAEVMENEAQAYLMFTDSAEFFSPDMIGMSKARLAELRYGFQRAMPPGWLRDSLGQGVNADKATALRH